MLSIHSLETLKSDCPPVVVVADWLFAFVTSLVMSACTRCELAEPCCNGAGSQPILSHLSYLGQQR